MGAPRSGDTITYTRLDGTTSAAKAVRIESNLCWTDYGDGEIAPFIWRFHDGLNTMHDWPGKATQSPTPSPPLRASIQAPSTEVVSVCQRNEI